VRPQLDGASDRRTVELLGEPRNFGTTSACAPLGEAGRDLHPPVMRTAFTSAH